MAEVIKTVLTADSSELAAEFTKASAIAQKYAAAREADGNRSLAAARAETAALRTEADGFSQLAASMRTSNALREQARRLSREAGIDEAKANAILREQQLLRRNIATATERQAAVEKAAALRAARIAAPGRNGVALPELALTTANISAMEKYAARSAEVKRQLGRMGQEAKMGGAMGLYAVSQALEDAQYGFKGVINNIPQAVQAFGNFTPASMRLAAGLSMVAVAGYAAYQAGYKLGADPSVVKWAETQTRALETARQTLVSYQETLRKSRDQETLDTRINDERERGNDLIERGLKLDEDRLRAVELQREAVERKRAAEDAIIAAAKKSGGFGTSRLTNASRTQEDSRNTEDIAASQQRLTDLARQWQGIWQKIPELSGKYAQSARSAATEYEQARTSLGALKSKQAELNELLKDKETYGPRDRARFRQDLDAIEAQIIATERQIAAKKAEKDLNESLAKQATTEGRSTLERLRQLMDAEKQRVLQLKDTARLLGQIRTIENQTTAASQWQAWQDAIAKSRQAAAQSKAAGQELMDQAKPEADQQKARSALVVEMTAMRLKATGRAAAADALKREFDLRVSAAQLAKEANLSEEKALQLLREKARIQRQLDERAKSRHRGIRAAENRPFDFNAGNNMVDWKWRMDNPGLTARHAERGLRSHELGRRAAERSSRSARPSEDFSRHLLKSVNIQEEMLKIWKKLNLV